MCGEGAYFDDTITIAMCERATAQRRIFAVVFSTSKQASNTSPGQCWHAKLHFLSWMGQ